MAPAGAYTVTPNNTEPLKAMLDNKHNTRKLNVHS